MIKKYYTSCIRWLDCEHRHLTIEAARQCGRRRVRMSGCIGVVPVQYHEPGRETIYILPPRK